MTEFNIVLAGVGGQGTILAGEILGTAAVNEGLNVRVSEIHGMAQRGGAVVSCVRIGDSVMAPTVVDGQADVLVGFEPLETVRNLRYASEKTLVIMNSDRIQPTELSLKDLKYPSHERVCQKIHHFTDQLVIIPAFELAKIAGSNLVQNSVLLGALTAVAGFPIKMESVISVLLQTFSPKYSETNVKAFQLGFDTMKKEYTRAKID